MALQGRSGFLSRWDFITNLPRLLCSVSLPGEGEGGALEGDGSPVKLCLLPFADRRQGRSFFFVVVVVASFLLLLPVWAERRPVRNVTSSSLARLQSIWNLNASVHGVPEGGRAGGRVGRVVRVENIMKTHAPPPSTPHHQPLWRGLEERWALPAVQIVSESAESCVFFLPPGGRGGGGAEHACALQEASLTLSRVQLLYVASQFWAEVLERDEAPLRCLASVLLLLKVTA